MKKNLFVLLVLTVLFCISCQNDVEVEKHSLQNTERALNQMQVVQNNALNDLYASFTNMNSELVKSACFATVRPVTRSVTTNLTEDEEDALIESLTEEQKAEIIAKGEAYIAELQEIAKVRVFDETDKPEGLIETNEAIYLGDIVISKLTPDGLQQAYKLAQDYYGEIETSSSRGAYLGVVVEYIFQATWPKGIIKYTFDGFPSEYQDDMRACMDEWEAASDYKIVFQKVTKFNWWKKLCYGIGTLRLVRITKEELDGPAGLATPGYCPLAYLKIDPSILRKTYKQYYLHTFRHELGHVLGLQHEFDRFDRDDYIIIKEGKEWKDFSVGAFGRFFINSIGDYDYNSVMNYENHYHIKNADGSRGKLISFSDIEFISEQDGKSVQEMYRFE